jgi:TonB-dependent starch-binding outer membrane protein SusC
MIGNSIPKFNFGLTASAFYKGFDIFMNWTGVMGNHVLYQFGYYVEGMIRPFNATTEVLNRWKSESDPGNGLVPRAVKTDPSINLRISDRFIYKGDYARLKLISIGYSIPKSILNKISSGSTDKFRIYISSDNLLTFAKYPGYNPEIGGSMEKGGNLDRGVDYGFWPVDRTIRFGFALNF